MGSHTSATHTAGRKPAVTKPERKMSTDPTPSIWWFLGVGFVAALMLWGMIEVLLSPRLTAVMQLLLLGIMGLPLMMTRPLWWRRQRRGLHSRAIHYQAIYALLLSGLMFSVLGGLLESWLLQQSPRPFLYPSLLAMLGLLLLWRWSRHHLR
jgi:hypothetical protein